MQERIALLINKYLEQGLTEDENQELQHFINQHPLLAEQLNQLEGREAVGKALRRVANINTEKNLKITLDIIHRNQASGKRTRRIVIGSALSVLIVVGGLYLLRSSQKTSLSPAKIQAQTSPVDSGPDNNKNILTLADGKQIWLDSISAGSIPGASGIRKKDKATLVYNSNSEGGTHTLRTSRAGIFNVVLSDGTTVSLNNGSTFRYPATFAKTERKVQLTGEAYFEIAKDAHKPFQVDVDGVLVNVLGTHFNITAYSDENEITTTLMEGKVVLSKDQEQYPLKPLDQAIFTRAQKDKPADNKNWRVRHDVDTTVVVDWKKNNWHFSGADLPTVLKRLSRWYNVDLELQGPAPKYPFTLNVPRTNTDTDTTLVSLLEQLGLKASHQGKKIIVTK
jgi:transmembrane sensor